MLSHRILGLFRLHVVCQGLLLGGLFWAWTWVLFVVAYPQGLDWSAYFGYSIAAMLALGVEALLRQPDLKNVLGTEIPALGRISVRQTAYVTLGMSLFLVFAQDTRISRPLLLGFFAMSAVFLFLSNRWLPGILARISFGRNQDGGVRTLLVGSAAQMEQSGYWAHDGRSLGMKIIGIVSEDTPEEFEGPLSFRHLGDIDDLDTVISRQRVQKIVLLGFPRRVRQVRDIITHCEYHGVRFLMLNDLADKLGRQVISARVSGVDMMLIYEEPLEDPLNRAMKRVLDIILASAVLATVLPFATFVAWCIHRFQSKGNLFYSQERSGWQGNPFKIWKFRTLHEGNFDENLQVSKDDPRVFGGGAFMRKFCIDELPQFWNVLKGDMSLVGPRPHLIKHDELFSGVMQNYRIRSFVKPGITGLAQVSGFRGETKKNRHIIDRVKCDISYLENWSLKMDLEILAKTALQVVSPPKSAY